MISYGGQLLLTDDPAALARVEEMLSIGDLRDFARQNGPGRLGALGFPWVTDEEDAAVNKLMWPVGASTWTRGWFLVDDFGLGVIRPQAYYNNTLTALPFVMNDGLTSITTNLFMLPPRPLGANLTGNDLYLLTLVDLRYFWWEVGASIAVTAGTTTWAQLFAAYGTALGVTIATDAIPAAYLKPTADFNTVYEWMPVQLDEAARNVGMRVVRRLDGTVALVGYSTGATTFAANMTAANALSQQAGGGKLNPIGAGGYMNLSTAGPTSDLGGVLPASVTTVFSAVDANGTPQANTPIAVTLAATGLFPTATTYAGTHLLYSSCVSGPSNAAQINALALQLAIDWYGWRQENPDVSLIGAFPWILSGMEDQVDWSHGNELIYTRVQRAAWNYRDDETQAYGSLGSLNTTVAAPTQASVCVALSSNQSIPNTTITAITWPTPLWDTLGFYSAGSPTLLTITLPGRYLLTSQIDYAPSAAGVARDCVAAVTTAIGNPSIKSVISPVASGATGTGVGASGVVVLAVGDTVALDAFQDSGGGLNALGLNQTFLQLTYLGR